MCFERLCEHLSAAPRISAVGDVSKDSACASPFGIQSYPPPTNFQILRHKNSSYFEINVSAYITKPIFTMRYFEMK